MVHTESLVDINKPPLDEMDDPARNLYYFLEIESIKPTVQDRIEDLQKNVYGAQSRMSGLRDMVKIIREAQVLSGCHCLLNRALLFIIDSCADG